MFDGSGKRLKRSSNSISISRHNFRVGRRKVKDKKRRRRRRLIKL